MSPAKTVHASVALVGEGGVLIRGASGSGKSSLLLSLLSDDAAASALVADDRVALAAVNGRLLASVPDEIAGLMEIRGEGIVHRPFVSPVVVDLVVDLAPAEACPRMPQTAEEKCVAVDGVVLPRLFIPAGASDGALRVRVALELVRQEKH